ncbi:sigma-70 family RNA polymerase sigma factor [Streptomyces sp. H10-C2]|uniref:sigma-70 family RNA polymerase sigma factor n=1 Tax=unclassified Streptomyces TaxID=2593676 RepID=UPI0024BBD80C|nr:MULTISPECIES: sigma-70 family RNA polymerase sigma factor [unclassified Streptomyces]MDJ0343417.1 sigma-70 family RNA polymerase sigma factor [Streptomyces sp. PH10-H1]MDJ0371772.1 sigma-70 family RNA polymerase sigma factor [Streptomyces sp. H10-C2]
MERECGAALVVAARAGDEEAREQLVAAYLPLVYNIVGRALDGHADVDDVVQETMLRALSALANLRDPASFRSWLVAIAMNQVRRLRSVDGTSRSAGLDQAREIADPTADFTDLTIWRLGLSGQRREVAEATRWLDADDRELLSLWWLEAADVITRDELAAGLGVPARHAAVRVQRMKEQLETGRLVVRALAAVPRCPELEALIAPWDQVPSALWRKRIARHARTCPACSGHAAGLVPAEGLLARLSLVPLVHSPACASPPDPHLGAAGVSGHASATSPPAADGTPPTPSAPSGPGGNPPHARRPRTAAVVAVALLVTGAVVVAVLRAAPGQPPSGPEAERHPTAPVSAAPSPAPAVPTTAVPAAPSSTAAPAPQPPVRPRPSLEQQVTELVNAQRALHGCRPVRVDARLHTAAQGHSDDMAARDYYQHDSPEGVGPDARITATGYAWSRWGENIDRGPATAARAVADWMNDAPHRDNILNCRFTHLGVGANLGSSGPYWTQDFAAH